MANQPQTTAPVTRRWVRFPRPGMPEFARYWYVMQTLVGSSDGSNRNRRFLYQGDEKVVTFNHRMSRDWHPDDDAALHALCRYLNEREFPETEEPKAVMDQPQAAAWQPRELIRLETLRQHDMQALGAAISRRDWQSTEMAYNQLRDKFDRAITELKHQNPPLSEYEKWQYMERGA